jgi:hypothetical protein
VGFSEAFRDGHSVGAAGETFLASRTTPSFYRKEAILLNGPLFHSISFIVTLKSEDVGNGNPCRTRKTIAAISTEPFSYLSHPIHKDANLF